MKLRKWLEPGGFSSASVFCQTGTPWEGRRLRGLEAVKHLSIEMASKQTSARLKLSHMATFHLKEMHDSI
jgi:hypothetical protein